jgi:molecular chaperone DnaK
MARDNTALGEFNLDGLPPAPRGVPKIEVTFDIDSNGILDVAAKDTATGRSQSIRISGSTRLPEDVKKRMVEEAERYAEQDRKRRGEADQLNEAESVCYQAEKTLADFGPKLSEELRKRLEVAIRETREALSKCDAAPASQRAEALKKVLQEAGAVLYAQSSGSPSGAAGTPSGGPRDRGAAPPQEKIVDAEFRETK